MAESGEAAAEAEEDEKERADRAEMEERVDCRLRRRVKRPLGEGDCGRMDMDGKGKPSRLDRVRTSSSSGETSFLGSMAVRRGRTGGS